VARRKNAGTKDTQPQYEQFLRALKLMGLGLDDCSAKLDRERYVALIENRKGVRQIETTSNVEIVGEEFFEPTTHFKLAVLSKKNEANPALSIECRFSAHFHSDGPISKEYATRFANAEFRVLMWPYFRQLVTDLAGRMAIPPILVPFASPAELKK
jgi:hypothetical protein